MHLAEGESGVEDLTIERYSPWCEGSPHTTGSSVATNVHFRYKGVDVHHPTKGSNGWNPAAGH